MKKLPEAASRWMLRLALAAMLLSSIGWLTKPAVSPLMCKIYG